MHPPRELLADRAYAELRDRIVTLRIPPGAPIDEDVLGRELEMGRTPVREAIKRLALENLVTVFPRRGTFASEINITDLAHISDVRTQLEAHAAARAAERLTDPQRAELEQLLRSWGRVKDERPGHEQSVTYQYAGGIVDFVKHLNAVEGGAVQEGRLLRR